MDRTVSILETGDSNKTSEPDRVGEIAQNNGVCNQVNKYLEA